MRFKGNVKFMTAVVQFAQVSSLNTTFFFP